METYFSFFINAVWKTENFRNIRQKDGTVSSCEQQQAISLTQDADFDDHDPHHGHDNNVMLLMMFTFIIKSNNRETSPSTPAMLLAEHRNKAGF
jgi:hypothetical protein